MKEQIVVCTSNKHKVKKGFALSLKEKGIIHHSGKNTIWVPSEQVQYRFLSLQENTAHQKFKAHIQATRPHQTWHLK